MGRPKIDDSKKSKIRTISLKNDEAKEIQGLVCCRSLTLGIRKMKEVTDLVRLFGGGSLEVGLAKLRVAMHNEKE